MASASATTDLSSRRATGRVSSRFSRVTRQRCRDAKSSRTGGTGLHRLAKCKARAGHQPVQALSAADADRDQAGGPTRPILSAAAPPQPAFRPSSGRRGKPPLAMGNSGPRPRSRWTPAWRDKYSSQYCPRCSITEEDALIPVGKTSVDVEVVCQTPGTAGNGYLPGQIDTIVDLYSYCTVCRNVTESPGSEYSGCRCSC